MGGGQSNNDSNSFNNNNRNKNQNYPASKSNIPKQFVQPSIVIVLLHYSFTY